MDGDKARDVLTQRILDLTLEMIFLLTGEDHVVVKIHEMDNSSHQIPGGYRRTQSFNMEPPPHSGIHEKNSEKILELTHRILRLLTGEVPIRYEDVTVHLSMEEWEYVERHKELYKDVMMEDHQPVITADKSESGEFHSPVSLRHGGNKNRSGNVTNNMKKCPNKTMKGCTESASYKEEKSLAFVERRVRERDLLPNREPTQTEYTLTDIKEESPTCDEGNLTERNIYKPPEHTQTECAPDHFGAFLKGNTNPMGINPSGTLIESIKPDRKIHYKNRITQNSACDIRKDSYAESDIVVHETDSVALKKHQRIHTGNNQFKCNECGNCFTLASNLARHRRIHKAGTLFECTQCGKCFTQAAYLAAHKRLHTGEKLFKCTECGKCFTQAAYLARHKRIHTAETLFKCSECEKCFTQACYLAAHKRLHTGERPFKCSECGKCFTCSSNLARHQKVHKTGKRLKCSECGKYFTQASHLAAHKRTHTGEKPFKCPECEMCFTWASNLARHQKIHTTGNLKCTECGKCFTQASHLATHKRIHTGEEPFKCTECGKCFTQASHFATHKRIHTGEKTFYCTDCGKCFSRPSGLARHKKIHMG